MNTLLHEIQSIDRREVSTVRELHDGIAEMIPAGCDLPLINHYIVTLYQETLSDGSKTLSLGFRVKSI